MAQLKCYAMLFTKASLWKSSTVFSLWCCSPINDFWWVTCNVFTTSVEQKEGQTLTGTNNLTLLKFWGTVLTSFPCYSSQAVQCINQLSLLYSNDLYRSLYFEHTFLWQICSAFWGTFRASWLREYDLKWTLHSKNWRAMLKQYVRDCNVLVACTLQVLSW